MKEIQLTQGKVALVDDEDYEYLMQWKWCLLKRHTLYAVRGAWKTDQKIIYMHRAILQVNDPKMHIDHINHDGLDNRRSNIRICTNQQNARNRLVRIDSISGYKGVWRHNRDKKWESGIYVNGECIHLGIFSDVVSAARVYDEAARRYFGEFACLNFPDV